MPWYLGATRIPEAFRKAPESLYTTKRDLLDFHFNAPRETWDLGLDYASGIFTLLGEMVDADYRKAIAKVTQTWRVYEDKAFALQSDLEETAYKLYQKDKGLAREYLNLYSSAQALKSLDIAWELINEVKRKYWGTVRQ